MLAISDFSSYAEYLEALLSQAQVQALLAQSAGISANIENYTINGVPFANLESYTQALANANYWNLWDKAAGVQTIATQGAEAVESTALMVTNKFVEGYNSYMPIVVEDLEDATVAGGAAATTLTAAHGIMSVPLPTVLAAVAPALGVAIGTVAGNALYDANPEWWSGLSDKVLPHCLQYDPAAPNVWDKLQVPVLYDYTGKTYVGDVLLNQIRDYMVDSGVYSTGDASIQNYPTSSQWPSSWWMLQLEYDFPILLGTSSIVSYDSYDTLDYTTYRATIDMSNATSEIYTVTFRYISSGNVYYAIYALSDSSFTSNITVNYTDGRISRYTVATYNTTRDGHTCYYSTLQSGGIRLRNFDGVVINDRSFSNGGTPSDICKIYMLSDRESSVPIEGTAQIPDAIKPTDKTKKLTDYFPEWLVNFLRTANPKSTPDSGVTYNYWYPVSLPTTTPNEDGVIAESSATDAQAAEDARTGANQTEQFQQNTPIIGQQYFNYTSVLEQIRDALGQNTGDDNPPADGTGDTPIIIPPSGSASSLFAIYNPSQNQLDSFGAWLWNSDFIEQLKKLFNDPMQSIIGLHKIFAAPVIGDNQTIKVGYLDSGVPSNTVANQYTYIDCGTIDCNEYFGNVFDYSPYTEINLFLPFIGVVRLDVADVMRSSINVQYGVDVLTGACAAIVNVSRDGAGGAIYTYSGNCAVQYPISSGSYLGIVSGILGIAGSVAATVMSGGAALPAVAGAGVAAMHMHTNVQHSGNLSGNAGAVLPKIPYLIISRPQTEMADNVENYEGWPASKTVALSSCTGFVQVRDINLENVTGTEPELAEIKTLLQSGVLI